MFSINIKIQHILLIENVIKTKALAEVKSVFQFQPTLNTDKAVV